LPATTSVMTIVDGKVAYDAGVLDLGVTRQKQQSGVNQ